jgi:hypothetical protein
MTQPPPASHPAGPPDPGGRQGPRPHGSTAHGRLGHAPAGPPRKRTLLPWLIGAALLLVAGLGTLLVFLLGGGDGERRSAGLTGAWPEEPVSSSVASLGGSGPLAGGLLVGHVGAGGTVCVFC